MSKFARLPAGVEWHFVGPLQTNKVRIVRPRVALIHSFDRDRLVRPWLKGPGEAPPALLQVNIGLESQKKGVPPHLVTETFDRWEAAGNPVAWNNGDTADGRQRRVEPTLLCPDEDNKGSSVCSRRSPACSEYGDDGRFRGCK